MCDINEHTFIYGKKEPINQISLLFKDNNSNRNINNKTHVYTIFNEIA